MSDIVVKSFIGSSIKTEFAGPDLYRLKDHVYVEVRTNDGTLCYTMLPGFLTNMRSGSHCIDAIIPKFTGNNSYNLALLCHDFAYTRSSDGEHYIRDRKLADEILRQMVILSGELGKIRAAIMYRALRLFGEAAYESRNTGDYEGVERFMGFRWRNK